MFEIFNTDAESPQDVKSLRDALLRSIKEELQVVEGGEGKHIRGLQLFITCSENEKHVYESAVYSEEPTLFKQEIQRIADDFAIDLPSGWTLEVTFEETLPPEAKKLSEVHAALFIKTRKQTIQKSGIAYIKILSGQAEKEEYEINSVSGKITIGREKRAQTDDGFFRINTIAFPGDCGNDCNKYISRQHAHVEWNNDAGCFMIFADEGGVPPKNKIKIKSVEDDNLIKLNSTHIGHRLKEGDQIILGETAVIEFSTSAQS
ncbi:MAG: FHA domain-containing protein [Sphingobacteriaceae bacterium]|nr:FHA domain-containing protein [Sphingobacteriaceae bacterium]